MRVERAEDQVVMREIVNCPVHAVKAICLADVALLRRGLRVTLGDVIRDRAAEVVRCRPASGRGDRDRDEHAGHGDPGQEPFE